MKKLFAIFAIAFATAASATTLGVGYEYMGVASQAGKTQQEKETVGLTQATQYGTVDGALTFGNTNGAQGNQTGFELGYAYPLTVGQYAVIPRVAFGNTSTLNADGHFAAVGAEGRFTAFGLPSFVAAEYRQNTADATATQKTYQVGVDYPVGKSFTVRAALKHANISNTEYQNGVAATVKYAF
jgi:hypothetical protein